MLYRLYSSPVVHCPRLCPYNPPGALLRDEYDPGREEEAVEFCGERCGPRREDERPCLRELAARRALLARGEPERRDVWLAKHPSTPYLERG